jgi:hypothetical protein
MTTEFLYRLPEWLLLLLVASLSLATPPSVLARTHEIIQDAVGGDTHSLD